MRPKLWVPNPPQNWFEWPLLAATLLFAPSYLRIREPELPRLLRGRRRGNLSIDPRKFSRAPSV